MYEKTEMYEITRSKLGCGLLIVHQTSEPNTEGLHLSLQIAFRDPVFPLNMPVPTPSDICVS